MKIAICISGQPRGIPENCEHLLKNIITPNDITDVFIHSWYDKNCKDLKFDSAQPGQTNNLGQWIEGSDKILEQYFNPKKIIIEPPNDFEQFSHLQNKETAIQSKLASMFYSMYKSNELKKEYEIENGFIYDIVIKTRVDLFYNNQFILKDNFDPNDNCLYVADKFQHMRQNDSYPTTDGQFYSSLSDTFIYGTSENIDKLCSLYENFELIHKNIWPNVYGEAYVGYQARHVHNLIIKTVNLDYFINRG